MGSPFIALDQKHIVTGNLRIAGNSKLRKLLTKTLTIENLDQLISIKCPNQREPRSANFNKVFAEITTGLEYYIENLASKTKYNVNNFDQSKKMILERINLQINLLQSLYFSDLDVLGYLTLNCVLENMSLF